ncbi:MAG: SUMF1/EgtB/PvdO family nonheme iron enzyme [Crocinitomicaceae bacterium]|jgi:formylglycine-generating enzyme required for sulfatase activity|nr:SUMF1/EgtB/PvdO family nonheme iron enzyme [Crocinitomicaceae bacterium]
MILRVFPFVLFLFLTFLSFGQSKKDQIRLLTKKSDSLSSVLLLKQQEIGNLKKDLEQSILLHSEDMNQLNQKISLLESELQLHKNTKSKKNTKPADAKLTKESKVLKSELATTKKVLDSLMRLDAYFKTGKSTIVKKEGKPKIEMVDIQGATYLMGSLESEKGRNTDEIHHKVTLSDYRISKYEITFEMYDAYCDSLGLEKPDDNGWGRGNRPVINVTWREANNFAQWMGGRLPTEAEWEYAARANGKFAFGKFNCLSQKQANFDGTNEFLRCGDEIKVGKTMPVGSYDANFFGVHDMFGNVYEWCSDWYGVYPQGTSVDPEGASSGGVRVNRGGSWANSAMACRAAARETGYTDFKGNRIGFRIVYSRD